MDFHALSESNQVNYKQSGFTLASILAFLYGLMLLNGKNHPILASIAVLMAVLAFFQIRLLCIAIDAFIRLGNLLSKFTNPVVFALVYIVAVVPVSSVLRCLGKDILKLRKQQVSSYWIPRAAVDFQDSFKHQF